MKKMVSLLTCFALLIVLSGCFLFNIFNTYKLDMQISLGLFNAYPEGYPEYSGETIDGLAVYGGKTVVFSAEGIESGFNDAVNIQKTAVLGWVGNDISSSTQYAKTEIDLTDNTMYLAGSYKFRMFIDWDESGDLTSGDLVFNSYSIWADKDDDNSTASIEVAASEYGTSIEYSASDYSIIIDDPLSTDAGFAWIITSIGEGGLVVY